jgi:hypothetical protein
VRERNDTRTRPWGPSRLPNRLRAGRKTIELAAAARAEGYYNNYYNNNCPRWYNNNYNYYRSRGGEQSFQQCADNAAQQARSILAGLTSLRLRV